MFKPVAAAFAVAFMTTAASAGTVVLANGSVTAVSALSPTTPSFQVINLGTSATTGFQSSAPLVIDGAVVTFAPNTSAPFSGVYSGTTPGIHVSPFTGTSVGSANSNYLVAQPGNNVSFDYGTATRNQFNLLWGSVDGFNNVDFTFFSGTTVVGRQSVSGSNVATAAGIAANGSTPAFVTIRLNDGSSFNRIEFSSGGRAFEFAPGAIPEPSTWAMMILGFGVVGASMRRRSATTRVTA